jgi:hypothetical protein
VAKTRAGVVPRLPQMGTMRPHREDLPISEIVFDSVHFSFAGSDRKSAAITSNILDLEDELQLSRLYCLSSDSSYVREDEKRRSSW